MERLTQCRVIEAEVPRHRVDLGALRCLDAFNSLLDLVKEATHSWDHSDSPQAHGWRRKARGRVRHDPGLQPNCAGQLLLPLRMGAIVRS